MDYNSICDNCGGTIGDATVNKALNENGRFLSHLDASVCFEKLRADLASMEAERDAVRRSRCVDITNDPELALHSFTLRIARECRAESETAPVQRNGT